MGGIGDHFQTKVRPISRIELEDRYRATTIINVHGPHSKVYHQSIDQSTTYVNPECYPMFAEIKEIISNQLMDESEKTAILDQVDALSRAENKETFLSRYKDFTNSLASHVTLLVALAPYLPLIAGLL